MRAHDSLFHSLLHRVRRALGRGTASLLLGSLLLSGLLLSGCGFHLRGEAARATLPPVQLQIDRARTPLAAAVAGAIRDADIDVRGEQPAGAAEVWRIRVTDQHEERRSRTLTRGIQVAEYELTVALDFVVLDASGNELHPAQRLSASRVYEREQENLLTNEAEEDVLWEELRRDVAAQLVSAVSVQLGTGVAAGGRPEVTEGTGSAAASGGG